MTKAVNLRPAIRAAPSVQPPSDGDCAGLDPCGSHPRGRQSPGSCGVGHVDREHPRSTGPPRGLVPLGCRGTAELGLEEFALVLVEVTVPGVDGVSIAELIRERTRARKTPLIFTSSQARDAGSAAQAYSQGAVDFLFKPLDPKALLSKVAVFVELFLEKETLKARHAALLAGQRSTDQKRAESRLHGLVDAMPLAVLEAGRFGEVRYCNEVWKRYSGLTAATSGRFGEVAAHPDDIEHLRVRSGQALELGTSLEIEIRLLRVVDNRYRWHLVRATPEIDETGEVAGWIATASDIEEHKRGERRRNELLVQEREAREEAQTANRMKDEFLATVSHELRTPLTAILGWARIIRTGKLDAARLERGLDVIERNGRAQAAIIDDILDVSRIITGKLRIELDALDLSMVVKGALDTVRPAAEAKGITLTWESTLVDETCAGDPDRLRQVVWNLVSNAIKFTPREGKVRVTTRPVDSHIEIAVTDTGQGISAEFLPHVFDRFRQADGTSTRRHGGLGLGLALVRHLVELHGGQVSATSEGEGRGSEFVVRLPLRAHSASTRPPAPLLVPPSLPQRPGLLTCWCWWSTTTAMLARSSPRSSSRRGHG